MILSKEIPGGNFRLVSQNGKDAVVEEEQRDSKNPWFYWKFKAVFDEPGQYRFHFTNANKIGPRSAAVSRDRGITWNWLSSEPYPDTQNFTFECSEPGEYWFCQCIPYMQTDFERFAAEYRDNPLFQVSVVGKTRKGRSVELVTIREDEPEQAIFLTARHHAQESMANYALEGIFRTILADTPFARSFRKKYAVYAVPFVDKDGVEDGDQGKGRIPRDHARDYNGTSLYPEITAIRQFLLKIKPVFSLDMHCPWIRFASNEYSYMTEGGNPLVTIELDRFAKILERNAPACAPFRAADILRWGVEWNVRANSLTGTMPGYGLKGFVANELNSESRHCHCQTVEIPFANFREKTITPKEIRLFGEGLIHTIPEYLDAVDAANAKANDPLQATICFAESLPDECNVKKLEMLVSAMASADYKIGFSDTVFFGDRADSVYPEMMKKAGFDFIVTAGKRCLEHGYEGLYQSLYKIEAAGLAHAGTARSPEECEKIHMPEINGIRVALFAYTVPFEDQKVLTQEERGFAVNVLPENGPIDRLAKDIGNARNFQADFVIVLMDSGDLEPQEASSIVCRIMDCGADLVVGNKTSAHTSKENPAAMITLRKENGITLLTGGESFHA